MNSSALPRYDWRQSYDWNYENAPAPLKEVRGERGERRGRLSPSALSPLPSAFDGSFCGLPVGSPLGVAAGPLLNGRWILYYASLGFDVLTYKTVRSRHRACYPMPNLQPVEARAVRGGQNPLLAADEMLGSWAVSFGMPSKAPDLWHADVEATRRALPKNKILSVSVVATPEPAWTPDDLAEDFARCARWAVESGADCVEANFSCPNVASADGQIYQQPEIAGLVAARLRGAVGTKPLLLKIGHVTDAASAAALVRAVAPSANAVVMVNCVSAGVVDAQNRPLFDGQRRGIAGDAIREAALEQVGLFARIIREHQLKLQLVGVGGIASADDVRAHLLAGSHAVQLATAAMLRPDVGQEIRRHLSRET